MEELTEQNLVEAIVGQITSHGYMAAFYIEVLKVLSGWFCNYPVFIGPRFKMIKVNFHEECVDMNPSWDSPRQ